MCFQDVAETRHNTFISMHRATLLHLVREGKVYQSLIARENALSYMLYYAIRLYSSLCAIVVQLFRLDLNIVLFPLHPDGGRAPEILHNFPTPSYCGQPD